MKYVLLFGDFEDNGSLYQLEANSLEDLVKKLIGEVMLTDLIEDNFEANEFINDDYYISELLAYADGMTDFVLYEVAEDGTRTFIEKYVND